jgi:hypothetical protein
MIILLAILNSSWQGAAEGRIGCRERAGPIGPVRRKCASRDAPLGARLASEG